MEQDALLNNGFDFGTVLPSGRPDISTLQLRDTFRCPAGQVTVRDDCVPCAPGTFFVNDKCELCAKGQYQPGAGARTCFPCSPGLTTPNLGSASMADCLRSCDPGHYFNASSQQCEECGFGFYQPAAGSFKCVSCSVGQTTLVTTATKVDDCRGT